MKQLYFGYDKQGRFAFVTVAETLEGAQAEAGPDYAVREAPEDMPVYPDVHRYAWADLYAAATADDATQEDFDKLGAWCERYNSARVGGDFVNAGPDSGVNALYLYPVLRVYNDFGDSFVVHWTPDGPAKKAYELSAELSGYELP